MANADPNALAEPQASASPPAQAAVPAASATVPLIDPRDNRIYSVTSDKADVYRKAGWADAPAEPEVNSEAIHKSLSGWYDNGQAVLFTVARGVPLAVKSLSNVVDANTFQNLAAKAKIFDEDHPILSTGLQVAGGLGSAAALAAGGGALAGALGIGTAAASTLGGAAAIGAAENVAYGAAYKVDNQAIEHALDPQGQEKLLFTANDTLLDAALGAAVPVGLRGLGAAIGKTGKFLTNNSIEMFRNAVAKGSSLDQIAAQGRDGSLYTTLDPYLGKSPEYIATSTKAAQLTAEQGMNSIKAFYKGLTMTGDEKMGVITDLKKILGTSKDPVFNDTYAALVKDNVDLLSLQSLAKKLSKRIVWSDPKFAENTKNLVYRDARDVVTKAQVSMLERADVTGRGDALEWARLNQQSSDNQIIYDALRSKRGQDVNDLLRNIGSSAIAGGITGALGVSGVGIAASALRSGAWASVHNLKAQHIAPFAHALGQTMLKVDGRIGDAVASGLYGLPGQVNKLTDGLDYDNAAAAVSLAGADPSGALANLQQHLDTQGVPQEVSVPIVQMQAAGLSHLASSMPTRNDAPDMATRDQGDPVQQHRWLEQVKTFSDPTHGIREPTADNLRILKQFYPQTLFNAQQALYGQIAMNPDLPQDARAWASRLLERPVGNLDSPTFAQTLSQARQAQTQAPQAGPSPSRSASSVNSPSGVNSSETRMDQLQNR